MADCCTTQGRTRARCLAGPRRVGTDAGARRWRPTTAGRRRGRAPCSSGPPPASASSSAPPPPPPPHNGEYTPRNKPLSAHGHEPAALMPGAGPGGSLKAALKIACVTPHTPWGREVRGSKQTTLVRAWSTWHEPDQRGRSRLRCGGTCAALGLAGWASWSSATRRSSRVPRRS